MPKRKKQPEHECDHVVGSTVMGERGQVVIPKDIRERLKLKAGHQMMVMQRDQGPIMLIPIDQMRSFLDHIHEQIDSLSAKS